jgi:hypothetical protein
VLRVNGLEERRPPRAAVELVICRPAGQVDRRGRWAAGGRAVSGRFSSGRAAEGHLSHRT